jgi:hypothetical protein
VALAGLAARVVLAEDNAPTLSAWASPWHRFQNGLRRFAMTKMQAAVRRARITRPSLS